MKNILKSQEPLETKIGRANLSLLTFCAQSFFKIISKRVTTITHFSQKIGGQFFGLILFLFLINNATSMEHTTIRPFGFPNRQPPTGGGVTIINAKIGLEAQQICGVTDWTTASLTLPKHLMSKKYWEGVGQKILKQARQVILDISGALPGMLACNVSPSWCSVLNKNQMMAAFESQLTFDSCQVLEGLENKDRIQEYDLKECVKKTMKEQKDWSAGMAREYCLVNPNSHNGTTSKEDKGKRAGRKSKKSKSIQDILAEMYPENVNDETNSEVRYNSGNRRYTSRTTNLRFAKSIFPGVQINNSLQTRTGGTFQINVDQKVNEEVSELEAAIMQALNKMMTLRNQGFGPKQIIIETSKLWNNKNKWKKNFKPHPFYQAAKENSEPAMLITPEQVLLLLPLVDESNPNHVSKELRQIIDRITRNVGRIKVTDKLADIHMTALDHCNNNPKLSDVVTQKNCNQILTQSKTSMEILQYKQENEDKAVVAQQRIANMVESIQRRNLNSSRMYNNRGSLLNRESIRMPWEIQ